MIELEPTLVKLLEATVPLVSNRIYVATANQVEDPNSIEPFVTYRQTDFDPNNSFSGPGSMQKFTYQVNCVAKRYSELNPVHLQVARINGFQGNIYGADIRSVHAVASRVMHVPSSIGDGKGYYVGTMEFDIQVKA